MRSRVVTGSVLLVLLLAIAGTCRQKSVPVASDQTNEQAPPASATVAANNVPAQNSPATATAVSNEEPIATLTAEDPAAEITVRSLPSQMSDPLGYGRVGESVLLGRTEADAEGYTWYYVTFQTNDTAGWIRRDLLNIPTVEASAEATADGPTVDQPPSDTLKQSLDETCGSQKAIEAYYVTPTNTIYICKVRGQRTYLSQEAGTEQVVTTPDVEALGGGYIVSNGNFEYRLDSSSLVVVRFDNSGQQEEVLRENIVYTERYK